MNAIPEVGSNPANSLFRLWLPGISILIFCASSSLWSKIPAAISTRNGDLMDGDRLCYRASSDVAGLFRLKGYSSGSHCVTIMASQLGFRMVRRKLSCCRR